MKRDQIKMCELKGQGQAMQRLLVSYLGQKSDPASKPYLVTNIFYIGPYIGLIGYRRSAWTVRRSFGTGIVDSRLANQSP